MDLEVFERHGKLGTIFTLRGKVESFNDVLRWLIENKIQYIQEYSNHKIYRFMIRDKTHIMAFKLRWS